MRRTGFQLRSVGLSVALVFSCESMAQVPTERTAEPLDPVSAIVSAFDTHDIVSLTDGEHGSRQAHEFLRTLIRAPTGA